MKLQSVYDITLNEDTPTNYIDQLVNQVLSKQTKEQNNSSKISFVNFNSKRKSVDSKRVDKLGCTLTKQEFISQGLEYFNKKYPTYSALKQIVADALDDYTF